MDFQMADQQALQIRDQSEQTLQKMQKLAQQLRTDAKDETTGRELAMDLREIAMQIQSSQQSTLMLLQQMGQYIHTLEGQLQSHSQPTVLPRGWFGNGGGYGSGGGFMSNLISGLGMGAGFGLAEDAVNDLFNAF